MIDLIIFLGLITTGYVVGQTLERRHYRAMAAGSGAAGTADHFNKAHIWHRAPGHALGAGSGRLLHFR